MKKITFILGLFLVSTLLFGQNKKKENISVSNIQLPKYQLSETKTYNTTWTTNVDEDVVSSWNLRGFNEKSIKGFLRLSGFDYLTEGADVNLNLICNDLILSEPAIINIASKGSPENYRANYRLSGDWKIEITGKHQRTINLTDIIDDTEVKYPALTDSYGAARIIGTSVAIEKMIASNPEKIHTYVTAQIYKALFNNISKYINEELGYLKKTSTFKLYTFKTNKKFDMSAWDAPNLKAIEMLNKIGAGENPSAIYTTYKDVFTFWDAEFEKYKSDIKENKNVLEVAVKNLINTLLLINPEAIKAEYIKMLDEFIFLRDLEERVADAKARQAANGVAELNFAELINLPVLKNYYYPVTYETTKGEEKTGMVKYTTPYYINPWETGNYVQIYDLAVYNSVDGKVVSKQAVDLKAISSYSIFGAKFVQMKFSDPAVIAIGGGATFLEELIKGDASAYQNFPMEAAESEGMVLDLSKGLSGQSEEQLATSRLSPAIVLAYGKKPIVIYSYSKLAEKLFDKKEISMKIAEGKYGNDPLKIKDAEAGKFSGGNNASNDIILEIIEDFNAQ